MAPEKISASKRGLPKKDPPLSGVQGNLKCCKRVEEGKKKS